ncbi:MAG: hypothetical protein ACPHL9_09625 [Limisphaerales bacterium]
MAQKVRFSHLIHQIVRAFGGIHPGVVLRETNEFDIFHHRRLGQATAEAGGD